MITRIFSKLRKGARLIYWRLQPMRHRAVDFMSAFLIVLTGPALRFSSRAGASAPLTMRAQDYLDLAVRRHHYYEPIVFPGDLKNPLDQERLLPGLNMREVDSAH